MRHTRTAHGSLAIPRPRRVTILALGVLIMACFSLTRVIATAIDWDFINQRAGISPLYLLLTGVIWALAWGCAWVGLWWLKRWGAGWMRGLAGTYTLYAWLERLFLYDRPAQAPAFQPLLPGNWTFLAGFNLLLIIWVFWATKRMGETDA